MNSEYQFEEWLELTDAQRRKIIHGEWNPYEPEGAGLVTRKAIAAKFASQFLCNEAAKASVGYFDKEGWCIAAVVNESSTPVPTKFAGLRVVKGVAQPEGSVKWVRM